ncbi:unnamed protein product, partial [Rotaria sp. Silwood2]
MHHKDDFNIEACWTFSATGHGKGPCDGIGATVKSSASRSILMSGTIISTVDDFYYFTKKFNDDAAQVNNTNEPPVHVYLLKRDVVKCAIKDVLTHRWKQLNGRIKGIRSFHQFDPGNDGIIQCRRTSNSLDIHLFKLKNGDMDEDKRSSLRQVNTLTDISIHDFVILERDEKRYLAQIIEINQLQQE